MKKQSPSPNTRDTIISTPTELFYIQKQFLTSNQFVNLTTFSLYHRCIHPTLYESCFIITWNLWKTKNYTHFPPTQDEINFSMTFDLLSCSDSII